MGTFSQLLLENADTIRIECSKYVHTAQDIEDLYQNVSIKLWRSFYSYNEEYAFSTWARYVVKSVYLDSIRKGSPDIHYVETLWGSQGGIGEKIYYSDELDILSPNDRSILNDRYVIGKTVSDLSKEYGVSESCIKGRIRRAKKRAKEMLDYD